MKPESKGACQTSACTWQLSTMLQAAVQIGGVSALLRNEEISNKEYAILPYKEFLKVQEELEDYEDLRCLREAKEVEKDAPTIGMAEMKKKIGRRTSCYSRRR